MESQPEIERILNIPSTRSTMKIVLMNGNSATPIHNEKKKNIWYIIHVHLILLHLS